MRKIVLMFIVPTLVSVAAGYTYAGSDEPATIPCPSCLGEPCARVRVCHHGTFRNEMCGDRLDCYKAPGEVCGETVRKVLGRCRPGLQCRCGICEISAGQDSDRMVFPDQVEQAKADESAAMPAIGTLGNLITVPENCPPGYKMDPNSVCREVI